MPNPPEGAASAPKPRSERGDPSWIAPALSASEKRREVGKTGIFFGPPLAVLTEGQKNTMEISGKLNRTAERYLEILKYHGLEITEPERRCLVHICHIGFMVPLEIRELSDEVRSTSFECDGLDKDALAMRLASASFADLVAVVEALGF